MEKEVTTLNILSNLKVSTIKKTIFGFLIVFFILVFIILKIGNDINEKLDNQSEIIKSFKFDENQKELVVLLKKLDTKLIKLQHNVSNINNVLVEFESITDEKDKKIQLLSLEKHKLETDVNSLSNFILKIDAELVDIKNRTNIIQIQEILDVKTNEPTTGFWKNFFDKLRSY